MQDILPDRRRAARCVALSRCGIGRLGAIAGARVAWMAAEGLTSQEIAQALFVATKTVDSHLRRAYAKLGINSRKRRYRAWLETRA